MYLSLCDCPQQMNKAFMSSSPPRSCVLPTRIRLIVTKVGQREREQDLTPSVCSIYHKFCRTHGINYNGSGQCRNPWWQLALQNVRMCPSGKYAVVDRRWASRIFVEMLAFFMLEACHSTTDIADVDILYSEVQTQRNVLRFQRMLIAAFTFPLAQRNPLFW